MRLDNQEFNFNFIENGENIIRCSNVEEAFFNIFNITLDEKTSFIKPAERYIDDCPIIKLNVEYGGTLYEDVEFKVVAAKGDKPSVFLNESTLEHGCIFEPKEPKIKTLEDQLELLAETIEATVELDDPIPDVDWQQLKQTSRQIHENKIAALIKEVEQQLSERIDESLLNARKSILAESINVQNKTQNALGNKVDASIDNLNALIEQWEHAAEAKISNYIIGAIDDARNAIEEQFEIVVQEQQQDSLEVLSEKIAIIAIESKQSVSKELQQIIEQQNTLLIQTVASADENIKEHVDQKLTEFKQSIIERNTESFDAGVAGFINTQTQWLQQFVEGKIANVQQTLDDAQVALEQKQDALAQKLTEHANDVVADASSKIIEEAKTLHQEQLQNVRQCVDDVIAEQIAALQPTTEIIVTEARNTQKNLFKDAIGNVKAEMSSEMKAHVANLQQDLYKKFAIYAQSYAGGGSVAAQFADGGTMKGTLNVANGQILSGGTDLLNIFSTTGASGYQTLAFNESNAQLTIAPNGNTISLSALSGVNAGPSGEPLFTSWAQTYSANYESTYSTVFEISANWDSSYSTMYELSANWDSTYSTVLNISANWDSTYSAMYELSANWENTYSTVLSNSANWNSTYSTVQSSSASWGTGGSPQTLSFDESTAQLSIFNGNTVSLSALSGSGSTGVSYLSALNDVSIPAPVDGQVLTYNNATNKWNANTPATAAGFYLPLSGGSLTGAVSTNQDIEITDSTKGIILRSPSNFKYRVTVTDAGELVTTLV